MSMDVASPDLDTPLAALRRAVATHADAPFIEFSGDSWTYQRFATESARLARGLRAFGVDSGDRVATMCDNNADAVLMWFATSMIGAIHVPINTSYKGAFLEHQLSDCGAKIVVAQDDYVARVLEIAHALPSLRRLLDRNGRREVHPSGVEVTPLVECRAADGTPLPDDTSPADIACLVYTSGTTGQSKGCMLSHNFLIHTALEFNRFSGRTAGESNWSCLPLFHLNAMAGTVLATMLLKARASMVTKFSLSGFWDEVERTSPAVVYLLGSMTPLIAGMSDTDAMHRCHGVIRSIIAAPCPPDMPSIFKKRFGVQNMGGSGFGQTEVGMPLLLPPDETTTRSTNGRPTPFFDVRIFDELDRELPAERIGEIVVRPLKPYIMFSGYWERPADTTRAWNNLWYHTGDLGKSDVDGYFYFVDRKKDYLRRGGENISSFEVEMALARHPHVIEAAAYGLPAELSEDEVAVAVVKVEGSTLTERELCDWSMAQLPYFAVPRFITFCGELPKNPVGRVLKFTLRDRGATKTTWDRQAAGVVVKR